MHMIKLSFFPIIYIALLPASSGQTSFLGAIQSAVGNTANQCPVVKNSDVMKSDPSSPPSATNAPTMPLMMWSSHQSSSVSQGATVDVMMPPPGNLVANSLMNRRSSTSLQQQLMLPDNLKTEVLDENSEGSLMSENSLPGMPNGPSGGGGGGTSTLNGVSSPLVTENSSRDASQTLIAVTTANSLPVQDSLLGVVDLMRSQHQMSLVVPQQSAFPELQEAASQQVIIFFQILLIIQFNSIFFFFFIFL